MPDAVLPLGADPPDDPPVFEEPWQAEAFALVLHLHAAGAFTWPEWAEALSRRIKAAGEADDAQRYYEHWLGALEDLVAARGMAGSDALAERKQAWAEAYRHTPHGQPVTLAAARA